MLVPRCRHDATPVYTTPISCSAHVPKRAHQRSLRRVPFSLNLFYNKSEVLVRSGSHEMYYMILIDINVDLRILMDLTVKFKTGIT